MSEVTFHFENGKDMKLNKGGSTLSSRIEASTLGPPSRRKKKRKGKKSKPPAQYKPNFLIDNISLADPDAEYPSSRVIRLNPNGELVVESLDEENTSENLERANNAISNVHHLLKLSPKPDSILFRYEDEVRFWKGLTDEEKLDILSVNYEDLKKHFEEEFKSFHNHCESHSRGQAHTGCLNDIDCEACEKDLEYINDEVRKEIQPHFDYLVRNSWFMQQDNTNVEFFDPKEDPLSVLMREKAPSSSLIQIPTASNTGTATKSVKMPQISDAHEFVVSNWEHKAFCDSKALVHGDHSKTKNIWHEFKDPRTSFICSECFPDLHEHTLNTFNFFLLETILLRTERLQTAVLSKNSDVFDSYKYKREYHSVTSPHERFKLAKSMLLEVLSSFPIKDFENNLPSIREEILSLYCIDSETVPILQLDTALDTALRLLREDLEPHPENGDILIGDENFEQYNLRNREDEGLPLISEARKNRSEVDILISYHYTYSNLRITPLIVLRHLWPSELEDGISDVTKDSLSENGSQNGSKHESCENECGHQTPRDGDLSDEPSVETKARTERLGELLGLFFIQSTQYVRQKFLFAFNQKSSDYRTQELIKELQAEEEAEKEMQLKKQLQKEKKKEKRLAQQKLKEEERKKKELEELEAKRLIEKKKEELRAEQIRQRDLLRLKKQEEKLKRIESLQKKIAAEKLSSEQAKLEAMAGTETSQPNFNEVKRSEPLAKDKESDTESIEKPEGFSTDKDNFAKSPLVASSSELSNPEATFVGGFGPNTGKELPRSHDPLSQFQTISEAQQQQMSNSKNHLLEQLYHVRPKSLSLSPHDPSISSINGVSQLNSTFGDTRSAPGPDIWSPTLNNTNLPVSAHGRHSIGNAFGPPQDLHQRIQANSLLSNPVSAYPIHNESRSRSIWSSDFISSNRTNWGQQSLTPQVFTNSPLWSSSSAKAPYSSRVSLSDGMTQSIRDASFAAVQNLSINNSVPSVPFPTMQVFQATKSILGTSSLGLSDFLKALSSSAQFELLYDDTGSVSHIQQKIPRGPNTFSSGSLFEFPMDSGPFDPLQTHSGLPQPPLPMHQHDMKYPEFPLPNSKNESLKMEAFPEGFRHPNGDTRSRVDSLGKEGSSEVRSGGIW